MSNKDKCPSGSQSDAAATFLAEINAAQIQGNAELHRYWANWAGRNTGNALYKTPDPASPGHAEGMPVSMDVRR